MSLTADGIHHDPATGLYHIFFQWGPSGPDWDWVSLKNHELAKKCIMCAILFVGSQPVEPECCRSSQPDSEFTMSPGLLQQ